MTQPSTPDPEYAAIDIRRIMEHLPHRFPFLLVDRITRFIPQVSVEAYKCVSINEPFFQGHFPGLPIMPGVLILESMAQAGGFLALMGDDALNLKHSIVLFTGIEKVRFRKPVVPGDRLDLHCKLVRKRMQFWRMHGTAHVDGALVAEAELTAAVLPKEEFA